MENMEYFSHEAGFCEAHSAAADCSKLTYTLSFVAMSKKGFTYITTNDNHTVLYTGATSTLKDRIDRHRNKKYKKAFTGRYNVYKLVWFQEFEWVGDALAREKQIKAGSRKKKIALIEAINPEWRDLYEGLDE